MVEDVREVIATLIVTSGRPVVHAFLVHEHQLVCRHLFHPQGEAGERGWARATHRVNAGRECEGGKGQRHTVVPSSSKPEVYPFEARISNDVYPRRAAKRGRSPAA